MGKRNKKRSKSLNDVTKTVEKKTATDEKMPSEENDKEIEKEILSDIQEKKNGQITDEKDNNSFDGRTNEKEENSEAKGKKTKDTDAKDTEAKDTESKGAEAENTESKDTDVKDSEKKAEEKNTESKNKETEGAKKENTDVKDKDTEKKDIEEKDKAKDEAATTMDMPIPFIDPTVILYKHKKRVKKIAAIVSASVIAAIYIGGLIISSLFFYDNTRINGIDVSGMSMSEAEKVITDDMNNYTLDIEYSNFTETIKVGDGSLSLSLAEEIKDIKKKQKPYLWFVHFGSNYDYDVDYVASFDDKAMTDYIMSYTAMKPENMRKSKNARVDISTGTAQIIPDETGTQLDTELTCKVIKDALASCDERVNIAENGCYIEADIKEDSPAIVNGYANAEDFLSIEAVYDFKGYKVSIEKEDLASMVTIDANGNLNVSRDKVNDYAHKFAEKYTTVNTERKFETYDGKIIGIHGRNYGWIINEEEEAEELYELICKKESFTKEPAYDRAGYAMCEMNDIGHTYIEIDLTNQHLYYFVDGKLVLDNDIVSGWLYNPNNYRTPGGLFAMDNKAYKVDLVGENYRTPVNYWMGFNGGIGIHDATWRSKFGGDIYKYDGSHGCINLPLDFAAKVYELAEPGMPVLCYWREEVPFYEK